MKAIIILAITLAATWYQTIYLGRVRVDILSTFWSGKTIGNSIGRQLYAGHRILPCFS